MEGIQRTKSEVAGIIEMFLDGTGGKWDWDEFCSCRISDPYLDSIRIQCDGLSLSHPPTEKGHYCNETGRNILRELVVRLRAEK